MPDESNALSQEERRALKEIHAGTLKMATHLGTLEGRVCSMDSRLASVEASVETTRIEVVKQGQMVGTLTGECARRGAANESRFSKQSEELDHLRGDVDEKISRLADNTNRLQVIHAQREGESKGVKWSWTVVVAVVGWVIAVGACVAGIVAKVM